jgi:membrane protein DedA with SNARE-associated domain
MWWQYLLVFIGSLLVDVVPLPLPPAFTLMVVLQIMFHLNLWTTVVIGVVGSVMGRYILAWYIPKVAGKIFKPSKNEDVQYLGQKLKEKGWKSHLAILTYSLLPLPTTPLFIAGGMAKMKPYYIIPAFFVGKFISDATAVMMGKYAAENMSDLLRGMVSWKFVFGLVLTLVLIGALLFIDWRTLLQQNKIRLKFKIWK